MATQAKENEEYRAWPGDATAGDPRVEISLAGGERLAVHRFAIQEAMSSLFTVRILARSPDPCLDLGADGYNEIRFEDRLGDELVSLRAERDLRATVGRHDYDRIAGGVRFRVLSPDECGCPDREQEPAPQPEPATAADIAVVVALSLLLLWLLVNDAAPGGQADDVLIPETLRRLAPTLARLLARLPGPMGPVPVVP